MIKLNNEFVERTLDDLTLLELCAGALRDEDCSDRTRGNIARLLDRLSDRMGDTVDLLDRIIANEADAEKAPPDDDLADIRNGIVALWDRWAARKRTESANE